LGATDIVVGSENSYYWGGVVLEAIDIVLVSENSFCWGGTGVVWCWKL